jgi:hypothetical protein
VVSLLGGAASPTHATVTRQATAPTAIAIAAGSSHTCALLPTGRVMCWGNNANGQLGDGTTTDSKVPVMVSGISTATAILGRMAAYTGNEIKYSWMMNASKLDLMPRTLEFGPAYPVAPVAGPGTTKLI